MAKKGSQLGTTVGQGNQQSTNPHLSTLGLWRHFIHKIGTMTIYLHAKQDVSRHVSLVHSTNRENGRTRVQSSVYLPELDYNSCNIHFYNNSDESDICGIGNKNTGRELIEVNYSILSSSTIY